MIELIVKEDYLICQLKSVIERFVDIWDIFNLRMNLLRKKQYYFSLREEVFLSEHFFFTGPGKPAPMSVPLPFWVRPLSGHILSPKNIRFETQRPGFSPNIPYLSYLNGFWTWVLFHPSPSSPSISIVTSNWAILLLQHYLSLFRLSSFLSPSTSVVTTSSLTKASYGLPSLSVFPA